MSKPQKLPSGKWRIRYVDADGKRISATFATFDLARTELRQLEVATDTKRAQRERLGCGAMTIGEAADSFLATYKPGPDDTPRRFKARKAAHERNLTMHIRPHLGPVKLCDLSPTIVKRWVEKLRETKTARPGEKNESGRTLSASMIRGIVTTLRVVSKSHDVPLVVSLAASLKQKRRRSRPRALQSIEDMRALVDACRLPWFRVAAALACYSGQRLGEIASLRWRHIGEHTITVAMSWEGPLKARYEDDEEAARIVPLDPELAKILEEWRAIRGGGPDDRIVMVAGRDGLHPLRENHDDVAARTRAACKRAGLIPLTFHSLRASYATVASNNGLPVSMLQVVLGHQDMRTTAIYVRPESALAAMDPRARLSGHVLDTSAEPASSVLN